jgi:hypothetical protein
METKPIIQINDLSLQALIKKRISSSISTYAASGIDVEVVEAENNNIKVKITQSKLLNGYILNQKELVERAKEIFKSTDLKVKVIPVVFSLDVDRINVQWIEGKMEEFGISRNDLVKQLAIDKSSLSLILSGNRELSKPMRATFFYYFLTYELNRDFREQLS